ncbi:MAG: helix-turn-helix domain-containing protein [candidate division Zixibacteria bacterium]|nr:helix-turn-helix domain-containing protein [candidate division Zixibacteria bacterium]
MPHSVVPEAFPPGRFIQRELDARGWKQVDLAQIMGVATRVVSELVNGKRKITPKTAQELGDAFNIRAEEWLNLQAVYELAKERLPKNDVRKRRSRLWHLAPIRHMINRGWIVETPNIEFIEAQIKQFYKKDALGEKMTISCASRKSTDYGELTKEQEAWLQRTWNIAEAIPIEKRYSQKSFKRLFEEITLLFHEPEEIRRIPEILARYGIRFLVVEYLPSSKIDGVCFWLSKRDPVIALTMRYNRIDWFWFTLCHELAHILYGDGQESEANVDISLVGTGAQHTDEKQEDEKRADKFAENWLVDQEELAGFVKRVAPIFTNASISSFARGLGVHPGIVVGQLQHKGIIRYSQGKDMLINVRDIVTESALTDGWGCVLTE